MELCQGGTLELKATEWGLFALKGSGGIVTACEVLLRDVVGGSDEEGEAGGCGGGPCGAKINRDNLAYKCRVPSLPLARHPAGCIDVPHL